MGVDKDLKREVGKVSNFVFFKGLSMGKVFEDFFFLELFVLDGGIG